MSQPTVLGDAEVEVYAVVRNAAGQVKRIIATGPDGVSRDLTPEQYELETGEVI